MLNLKEGRPLDMLRQFSVDLNGDLREDLGASKLIVDNERGKGTISLYEVFPGLTAWVYNITFFSEYTIDMAFGEENPYYFGYHVTGHQMTKFGSEERYQKINEGQNFILTGEQGTKSEFVIPANINYQCCYLIIHRSLLAENLTKVKTQLNAHLDEIFDGKVVEKPYRYFGNIDFRTGFFADIVVKNDRTDLVGRLLVEAAILNMLASQITAHDHDKSTDSFEPELTKSELKGVFTIGDRIREHLDERLTIEMLSKDIGISPKKLQAGTRFLFGCSVNEYASNIRLEKATEMMRTTDLSISEICYKIGLSSRSYFSKLFKDRYGISPIMYKKSYRENNLFFEVAYRSFAITEISTADVADIIKTSRKNNPELGITGCLIYHRKVFFQLIEGPKKEVNALYEKIKGDSRHFDISTLWQGAKPIKDFAVWDLALISDEGILSIPKDGDTKGLDLGHLMGDIDDRSLASQNLWRKVRNTIKTA